MIVLIQYKGGNGLVYRDMCQVDDADKLGVESCAYRKQGREI